MKAAAIAVLLMSCGKIIANNGEPEPGHDTTTATSTTGTSTSTASTTDPGVTPQLPTPMPAPTPVSVVEPPSRYLSGTRVKAQYFVGDDGSKVFRGMYDSARKEGCTYVGTADGKTRCVGLDGAVAATFFTDDKCTQPIFSSLTTVPACDAPKLGYVMVPNNQCTAIKSYQLFDVQPKPLKYYPDVSGPPESIYPDNIGLGLTLYMYTYVSNSYVCSSNYVSYSAALYTFFLAGPEVAYSRYARADVVTE